MAALIFESIFFGYGLLSILKAFIAPAGSTNKFASFRSLDDTATSLVRYAGIGYLFYKIVIIYIGFKANVTEHGTGEEFALINRMTGPYWYAYWLHLLFYPLTTQSLWIKRIKESNWIRIILGILFLFSYEKMVVIITSLERDYLPFDRNMLINTLMLNWIVYIAIFGVSVGLLQYIKNKSKSPGYPPK